MPPKTIKKKSSSKSTSLRHAPGAIDPPRGPAVSSAEEELFAKVFRSSPHPIGITELETGRCLEVNDACLEIFGFRRDEVVGETTLMLGIWPDPQERVRLIDRLRSEETVRNLEVSMRMKDGELRWFIISTDLITLGGKPCLLTIGNDITERKKAEDALRVRSAELQITLDTAATGLVRNGRDFRYRWVNVAYAKLVGRPVEDIVGHMVSDVLGDEGFAKIRPYIDRVLSGERVEFETELPISGRGLHWLHVVYLPDRDAAGDVIGWVGSITDITERKQAEDTVLERQRQLQQSQAQLQDLTAKLFSVQDSERQRIARDLHDDFSQRLASLVLDVGSLQRHPPLLPELIGKALEPVREELQQLSDDLHNLAYRLHPPLLQHVGLQAAIEARVYKAIERTGLHITLRAKNLPGAIPLDWSLCLFPVFQESLQNVAKHARATEVSVRLSGSSKGVGLSVIDNGRGFDASDKSGHQKGLGLISMQERLRLMNGFLNIHSRPAGGTKVCAWIPFRRRSRDSSSYPHGG